jgi:hypothetical protein
MHKAGPSRRLTSKGVSLSNFFSAGCRIKEGFVGFVKKSNKFSAKILVVSKQVFYTWEFSMGWNVTCQKGPSHEPSFQ